MQVKLIIISYEQKCELIHYEIERMTRQTFLTNCTFLTYLTQQETQF